MGIKKKYSQAAIVQGILRTLGARQGITIGELAEQFGREETLVLKQLVARRKKNVADVESNDLDLR
jgi:hypothetical protein